MADSKLPALTEVSVPALDDPLYLVDVSDTTDDATGSSRKVTNTRLLGLLNHICQGRLTLESGVPVSTSDQTAKTSVYFTPYNGNRIAIYDGTRWRLYTFTELTLALGTLTSGKNYDVFIYDNAGTLTLELSAAWTNDTTRADALTTQDGVYVKSGATTRRYLGTIRTTSTTTTEDSLLKRFCWNLYNQQHRPLQATDSTDSWSYSTQTIRQANAATANKFEFVVGVSSLLVANVIAWVSVQELTGGEITRAGIGIDSITAFSGLLTAAYITGGSTVNLYVSFASGYKGYLSAGYHYAAWLESGAAGTASVFVGDFGGSQCGIFGEMPG